MALALCREDCIRTEHSRVLVSNSSIECFGDCIRIIDSAAEMDGPDFEALRAGVIASDLAVEDRIYLLKLIDQAQNYLEHYGAVIVNTEVRAQNSALTINKASAGLNAPSLVESSSLMTRGFSHRAYSLKDADPGHLLRNSVLSAPVSNSQVLDMSFGELTVSNTFINGGEEGMDLADGVIHLGNTSVALALDNIDIVCDKTFPTDDYHSLGYNIVADDSCELDGPGDMESAESGLFLEGDSLVPQFMDGEGIFMEMLGNGKALVYLFSYRPDGSPFWALGIGNVVGNGIVIPAADFQTTQGATFGLGFDPNDVERLPFAELSISFPNCSNGSQKGALAIASNDDMEFPALLSPDGLPGRNLQAGGPPCRSHGPGRNGAWNGATDRATPLGFRPAPHQGGNPARSGRQRVRVTRPARTGPGYCPLAIGHFTGTTGGARSPGIHGVCRRGRPGAPFARRSFSSVRPGIQGAGPGSGQAHRGRYADVSAESRALVTGASGGIGMEIAHCLAQRGYNLVIAARSQATLESLASQWREQYSVEVLVHACDLSREEGRAGLLQETIEKGLQVDVLINNAGFGTTGDFAALGPVPYKQGSASGRARSPPTTLCPH